MFSIFVILEITQLKTAFFSIFCHWQDYFIKGDEGGNFSKAQDWKPLFLLKVKIKQKPASRNKEYNVAFKHSHQNIRAYPRSKKNLRWSMIGKMLHIGKNGEKCCISRGSREARKVLQFFPSEKNLEIVFPTLKLTRNCYLNMNISFSWKLPIWSTSASPSLFYKHTVPANKIWNQWDLKNPNV